MGVSLKIGLLMGTPYKKIQLMEKPWKPFSQMSEPMELIPKNKNTLRKTFHGKEMQTIIID